MVTEDTTASVTCLPPDCVDAPCEESTPELKLDLVTQERLTVAASAADTLEALTGDGTWDKLDPSLAKHLRRHAQQLCRFLERVQRVGAVQDHESELLGMRRVQRRLEIALEILRESEEEQEGESSFSTEPHLVAVSDLFMGDFTNAEVSEAQKERAVEVRRIRVAKKAKSKRKFRLVALVVAAGLVIAVSVGLVAISEFGRPKRAAVAPTLPLVPNRYLEDVRFFVPAVSTYMMDGGAQIIVERSWANRRLSERKEDVAGLQVFLANRGVTRLVLSWQGGSVIAVGSSDEELSFIEEERNAMMDDAEAYTEYAED